MYGSFLATRQGIWIALVFVLVIAFLIRAIRPDQPIVENYVGRQIPTAMVARNLERGSGFLYPQIDVAPLPNLFLVEPPVYAAVVVGLRRVTPLSLAEAGRLVSALGIVLGAWGLYGLVARREGEACALVAVALFIAFPVTIRYGRAFQPDALMLGTLLAGLRGWDQFEYGGNRFWLALGVLGMAAGLALKVISAYLLLPLCLVVMRDRKPWKLALAASTLVPAGLWYLHAAGLIASGTGSRASADNGEVWLGVLRQDALFRFETYRNVARFLMVRAFTPMGLTLALPGLFLFRRPGDALWRWWGGCALLTLAALSAKLHHEYYWLALAPVMAVGTSRTLMVLYHHGRRGRILCMISVMAFFGLAAVFSAGTWQTPDEWRNLDVASFLVREYVPEDDWVVAPEALLFAADRRGCRLEYTASAARRAAGEWSHAPEVANPGELVAFYRSRGARFFADVIAPRDSAERLALRQRVRDRYNVLVDTPEVLLAKISASRARPKSPEGAIHGIGRADEPPREAP